MPEIRRRRVSEDEPVTRRRDRSADPEEVDASAEREPEEGDGWEDEPEEKPKAKRRPEPEPEEDEPAPARRSTRASAVEPEEEDDRPARRTKGTKAKLPPGVHTGRSGAEALRKSRGDGAVRVTLTEEPQLFKFLEPEPFVSYAQHWVAQGGGSGNRPYTCPIDDCPLCELGDRANVVIAYNVLDLSAPDKPVNKVLQLGIKADRALVSAATSKKTDRVDLEKDYFAISRSGKGQQSQTNFVPIKERDIQDDWEELLDNFDLDALPDLIADAQEHLFDISIVQVTPMKQLREVASYLAED